MPRPKSKPQETPAAWHGPRFQRITLKYRANCTACKKPLEPGDKLMWDSRNPGNIFCDKCADEYGIATPRERTLFDAPDE